MHVTILEEKMAKDGDPNHGPSDKLNQYRYKPDDTQPTGAVRRESAPKPEIKVVKEPLPFGIWNLVLLVVLIWGAEWLGTTLPGPFDDMLYEAIAALFFGFIQYIRSLLYKK